MNNEKQLNIQDVKETLTPIEALSNPIVKKGVGALTPSGGEIFNDYENNHTDGMFAHAEGTYTSAAGNDSHSEGSHTIAFMPHAHVEGYNTLADGRAAHSEGIDTQANGKGSHAEGIGTAAESDYQHVQGKYNIADFDNKYAHIIGSGTPEQHQNAATIDWDGNLWLKGGLHTGGNSYINSTAVALVGHKHKPQDVGLGNVTDDTQVKRAEMGQPKGVATLDTTGKVPASQLPDYVDDVIEVENYSQLPSFGHTGKIYITTDDNQIYRWEGADYQILSDTLKLGNTSTTAYTGDKGAQNRQDIDAIKNGTFKVPLAETADTANYISWEHISNHPINMPASDVYDWAKAAYKPIYTKEEVGLDQVDNIPDAEKSVKYALRAAEVNSIKWENVLYRPTSLPASDVYSWAKASVKPTYNKTEIGLSQVTNDEQVKRAEMGQPRGVATLDEKGHVLASQLPSYIDNILEYANQNSFPTVGETGKIYVALDTNKTYRWSGSSYVIISETLALGTTSSTAYRGDLGDIAYKHSQITSGNPHGVTKAEIGLANVENKSSEQIRNEITKENVMISLGYNPIKEISLDNVNYTSSNGVIVLPNRTGRITLEDGEIFNTYEGEEANHAFGIKSHAEGQGTTATGKAQHVQGKFNIEDTENKYAHIVGNGTSQSEQSNAHTLDWIGNAWYQGTIRIGGTNYDDANEVALKKDLTNVNVGLDKVENKSSEMIRNELTKDNIVKALGYTPMDDTYASQILYEPDESVAVAMFSADDKLSTDTILANIYLQLASTNTAPSQTVELLVPHKVIIEKYYINNIYKDSHLDVFMQAGWLTEEEKNQLLIAKNN